MKITDLTFNNISSRSFGLTVAGAGTFDPAEPDVTAYSIPGRNGDILLSNHRYKNIKVTYPAFIPRDFTDQVQGIRNWIRSATSYKKLQDSFDPGHYRLAIGTGVTFRPVYENVAANMSITFNCKPQRFLTSHEYNVVDGGELTNPTGFTSFPMIRAQMITEGGTITFTNAAGTYTLTATDDLPGTTFIDCENMVILVGGNLRNDLFSGDFPKMHAGKTTINFSGVGILFVAPEWWEL